MRYGGKPGHGGWGSEKARDDQGTSALGHRFLGSSGRQRYHQMLLLGSVGPHKEGSKGDHEREDWRDCWEGGRSARVGDLDASGAHISIHTSTHMSMQMPTHMPMYISIPVLVDNVLVIRRCDLLQIGECVEMSVVCVYA